MRLILMTSHEGFGAVLLTFFWWQPHEKRTSAFSDYPNSTSTLPVPQRTPTSQSQALDNFRYQYSGALQGNRGENVLVVLGISVKELALHGLLCTHTSKYIQYELRVPWSTHNKLQAAAVDETQQDLVVGQPGIFTSCKDPGSRRDGLVAEATWQTRGHRVEVFKLDTVRTQGRKQITSPHRAHIHGRITQEEECA